MSEGMTREEAYKLAMRACEETWNEKICKQIKEALEQEPFINKPCVAHKVCHEDKVKVLGIIRAAIEEPSYHGFNEVYDDGFACATRRALQIIDKYKEE